jgi:hypothetical protein
MLATLIVDLATIAPTTSAAWVVMDGRVLEFGMGCGVAY